MSFYMYIVHVYHTCIHDCTMFVCGTTSVGAKVWVMCVLRFVQECVVLRVCVCVCVCYLENFKCFLSVFYSYLFSFLHLFLLLLLLLLQLLLLLGQPTHTHTHIQVLYICRMCSKYMHDIVHVCVCVGLNWRKCVVSNYTLCIV